MRILTTVLAVFFGIAALSVSANAQTEIYGLGNQDEFIICPELPCELENISNTILNFGSPSSLYKVDPNDGFPNFIGLTGFADCQGLEAHPDTGELYAVCNQLFEVFDFAETRTGIEGQQVLIKLNKDTGEGTEIGQLGDNIGINRGNAFVSDISFDENGVLFAHVVSLFHAGAPGAITNFEGIIEENTLGWVDLATGEFMPIGPTGSGDNYSAIGFNVDSDLKQCANFEFVISPFTNLNKLNTATGMATPHGSLILPPELAGHLNVVTSKDIDEATGYFFAFVHTEELQNGAKGLDQNTNNLIANGTYLALINPESNILQLIGRTSDTAEDFNSIAVISEPRMVPTMSEYGLIVTVVLLLGAAVVVLRRRQAKSEI